MGKKEIESWSEVIQRLELKISEPKYVYVDEQTYDKLHIAYCLMKDLLIEMNNFGDLDGYDVENIFKLIGELSEND